MNALLAGIKIAWGIPSISHLFEDDSLFVYKAKERECRVILELLRTYGKASGQKIKFKKSSVMFGQDVPSQAKNCLKLTLGIDKERGMSSYSSIPESLGMSKTKIFNFINERIHDRVNVWSAKFYQKEENIF